MKLEITQQQYEHLKAVPQKGLQISEEVRYYAEQIDEARDLTDVITGHYKAKGIRRARNCEIVLLDLDKRPKGEHMGQIAEHTGDLLTGSELASYTGTELANALADAFDAKTPDTSAWVTLMIESRMLGFRNP
jgi:hypothetical protein